MRTLAVAFVFIAGLFGITNIANAADGCTTEGADCTISTTGSSGKCVRGDLGDLVCGLGIQTNPGSNSLQTNPGSTGNANTGTNVTLINPLQGGTLESFLYNILAFVIRIGTVIVILMMVYVGYLFVAAQGKEEKIREARSALLWTVVGALILLGSQVIAAGIKATVQALSVGQ